MGPPSPVGWFSHLAVQSSKESRQKGSVNAQAERGTSSLLVHAIGQGVPGKASPDSTGRGDGLRLLVGGGTWHRDGGVCWGLSFGDRVPARNSQWQVGEVRV